MRRKKGETGPYIRTPEYLAMIDVLRRNTNARKNQAGISREEIAAVTGYAYSYVRQCLGTAQSCSMEFLTVVNAGIDRIITRKRTLDL